MARYTSKGTLFKIGDGGGPEVFTTVGQVIDVQGPNESRETVEATDHDTVAAMEYLAAALYDGGEVTLELHWDPALATQGSATGLAALLRNGTKRNCQIVFPTSPARTFSFAAFVTGFNRSASSEPTAKLTGNVTLKVTGAITEA